MAWFKKKEQQEIQEDIPKLPELPEPDKFSLPELPKPISSNNPGDLPELPTLPELRIETNLTPKVIRKDMANPKQGMQKSQFKDIKTPPKEIPHNPIPIKQPKMHHTSKPRIKDAEPIYVRLDKFEASLNSFEEIKRKITEVEDILKKTKEIKQKEEQELEAWEREIQIIKSRIDAIDKTIFNKLD